MVETQAPAREMRAAQRPRPRPSHRKSLSTSALAVSSAASTASARNMAPSPGPASALTPSHAPPRPKKTSSSSTGMPVHESASMIDLPGLTHALQRRSRERKERRVEQADAGGLEQAIIDLSSLRSSGRRRLRALHTIKRALVDACSGQESTEELEALVSLNAHVPILTLLARHMGPLAKRAGSSSLPPGDELASHLAPELEVALSILQGLTLLSPACKNAVGERWVMEMFLDLLLLLRAQAPPEGGGCATAFSVLDLLFSALVESSEHTRTFEDLGGLEAITRVLKGYDVAKVVRMRCCEFLYFYLLPEGATEMPDMNAIMPRPSPTASSDQSLPVSADSTVISTNDRSLPSLPSSPNRSRLSMEPTPSSPGRQFADLDQFVPQTPRRPAKYKLGFHTPAANRRVSGTSTATSLTPVTQSPVANHRDGIEDDGSLTKRDSAAWKAAQKTGLLPRDKSEMSDAESRKSSSSSSSSSITVVPKRLDLQPLSSRGTPVSATPSPHLRMSAVSAAPRALARSNTQPVLADDAGLITRRPNHQSSLKNDITSEIPEAGVGAKYNGRPGWEPIGSAAPGPTHGQGQGDRPGRGTHMRHSRTQSALSNRSSHSDSDPTAPRGHVRSKGFPSDLTRGPLPSPTPRLESLATSTPRETTTTPATTPTAAVIPITGPTTAATPSTGLTTTPTTTPPAPAPAPAPTPVPATPLGPSRRLPSTADKDAAAVRSVMEKKAMLGQWIGNVDQLMHGVEKAGFWGSR